MEAAVEAEMMFNGGDERAARALVQENTDNGAAEITDKLREAQGSQATAA
jgi:hypothetical protein